MGQLVDRHLSAKFGALGITEQVGAECQYYRNCMPIIVMALGALPGFSVDAAFFLMQALSMNPSPEPYNRNDPQHGGHT